MERGLADGWVEFDSAFRYGNVSATGVVPFLPAGPATVTVGSDYRVQSLRTAFSPSLGAADLIPSPATDRDRTVSAVFVQSSTPMLSPELEGRWPVRLDLSAGLRYEHFSDAGQGVMRPLVWASPRVGITVKGTWARLFRAPNLPDLNESPNLRPENSNSWTLGVAFAPPSNPNLTLRAATSISTPPTALWP